MLTILHASDLQIGSPYRPDAGEALVSFATELGSDVIVVAGDLTQRAKAREYRTAVELLARFPEVPVVVTPGNHDVPLYRFWERLLDPYRKWRRFFLPELDTVTTLAGATIVALNSSAPLRAIVSGRIDAHQLDFARTAFSKAPPADVRVLVVHHHFVPTPDGEGGRPIPGARRSLAAFEEIGVDLVLGGHVHQTHISTSTDLCGATTGPGIPLVACGTTTSRRGRGSEAGGNSLNVIRVRQDGVEVLPHRLGHDGLFVAGELRKLPRGRAAVSTEAPLGETAS